MLPILLEFFNSASTPSFEWLIWRPWCLEMGAKLLFLLYWVTDESISSGRFNGRHFRYYIFFSFIFGNMLNAPYYFVEFSSDRWGQWKRVCALFGPRGVFDSRVILRTFSGQSYINFRLGGSPWLICHFLLSLYLSVCCSYSCSCQLLVLGTVIWFMAVV